MTLAFGGLDKLHHNHLHLQFSTSTMSDKKGAYGAAAGSGDTDFRKTYDKAEYAQKALEREARERAEGKARAEARAAGKKYHAPSEQPPKDGSKIVAREKRLNFEENLNKTTLVPAGAGMGKRGHGAGFYCEACDLTYKDSLQFVDHLNSKQHLFATGQTGEVEVATLEDVKARLQYLKEKRDREMKEDQLDLKMRLEEAKKAEEEERKARREKKKQLKAKKKAEGEKKAKLALRDVEMKDGPESEEDEDARLMAQMMGFSGAFGTTKKRS